MCSLGRDPSIYFCGYTNLYPLRDQIKRHTQTSQNHTYTLFLVPRTSTLATRILEEEGVLGEITVSSYNLQFIPLEDDVISLEYDTAFKEIWVVRIYWLFFFKCDNIQLILGWR